MNIFSNQPGVAVLVPDAGFPFGIELEGWKGAATFKAIITSFGLSAMGNFQFLHTLRNFVYVYVFGDRMSEITVQGLAMADSCNNEPSSSLGRIRGSGIELLWDYYQENKLSAKGTPVSIAIGTKMSFYGFLTGFNFNANDPLSGLSQWAMRFHFHNLE